MAKDERKQVIVRMSPDLLGKLTELAANEYRSVNGEIEYLVAQAVSVKSGTARTRARSSPT